MVPVSTEPVLVLPSLKIPSLSRLFSFGLSGLYLIILSPPSRAPPYRSTSILLAIVGTAAVCPYRSGSPANAWPSIWSLCFLFIPLFWQSVLYFCASLILRLLFSLYCPSCAGPFPIPLTPFLFLTPVPLNCPVCSYTFRCSRILPRGLQLLTC